jgi:hypothetical protein
MLPDDVLLEIFNFYLDEDMDEDFEPHEKQRIEEWITLVQYTCVDAGEVSFFGHHVASICDFFVHRKHVRGTPWTSGRLCLSPFKTSMTSSLTIHQVRITSSLHSSITTACQIDLSCLTRSKLEYVTDSAAMHKPFPELTDLHLSGFGRDSILPDSFLGGTTPRLLFWGIPFPGLPKLLLSATHLVYLSLDDIPRSGYIPPEAMATSISALTNLEYLRLEFQYPRPRPALGSRRPPPLTRSILPSLTGICFKGASEYLEEILARIDAPRLNELDITFFNQIIFDTPQLFQFISRRPTLKAPEKGHISFNSQGVIVKFPSQTSGCDVLSVRIPCTASA